MRDVPTRELLVRLFSDAHVIDIDMSEWDRRIALLIVADHYDDADSSDTLPIVLVEFHEVRSLSVSFAHHELMRRLRAEEPELHLQWRIDEFKLEEADDTLALELSSTGRQFPRLELCFDRMSCTRMSVHELNAVFPGGSSPGSGFVRPGILPSLARRTQKNRT